MGQKKAPEGNLSPNNATQTSDSKRELGQFFTATNPFNHPSFDAWASQFSKTEDILEPFAGANGLIPMLRERGLAKRFSSFDIAPANSEVRQLDTLRHFPAGFKVCVTNPPYLASNVAKRKNVPIPALEGFDNLYKLSIKRCLDNCQYVAAIIPESFLTAGLFRSRLYSVISLPFPMFDETEQPVCLALWNPENTKDYPIYHGNKLIGSNSELMARLDNLLPTIEGAGKVVFNTHDGNIGLRAIDSTKTDSIIFVSAMDIPESAIKVSARHLSRILVEANLPPTEVIAKANVILAEYRRITEDVFMTSFMGLREDGHFRRRLDFATARRILQAAIQ
jgi:hypothetical protein